MDIFLRIILRFRNYRAQKLRSLAELLSRVGITANLMTLFSLASGLLAVYFLFADYFWFLLFGILHLAADALDGVLASIRGGSTFGKYFDYGTDNVIAVLIVLKIGYFLQDYYAYIVAGLYLLAQLVYLFSKLTAPILFGRSVSMIALFLYLPSIVSITSYLPVLVYLFVGVISVYSLGRQLQWAFEKKF